MTSNPSLRWQKLHDVFYSHVTVYESLNWSVDNLYLNFKVSISPNGTLIALASKFVPHPNVIDIYSINGNKIWTVVYNSRPEEHIVDFHFRDEELCLVLSNRKIRYYHDFKGSFEEYDFTKEAIKLDNIGDSIAKDDPTGENVVITNLENNEIEEVYRILDSKIWRDFLILRLQNRFVVINLTQLKTYEISLEGYDSSKINSFEAIHENENNSQFVLLFSYDKTIISSHIDINSMTFKFIDNMLTDGPFNQILPSPNGKLISLVNNKIYVINNKFTNILLEYNLLNESHLPYQIAWCSNDAICISLKDEIKLIGPNQNSVSFFYDIDEEEEDFDIDLILNDTTTTDGDLSFTIPILLTQSDGLKIITSSSVEFINKVPDSQINLYQIGSSSSSSILLDCIDKLSNHASKADTNISLLKSDNSLESAITECLEVVLEEFDQTWQKKILRAVSFGKTYFGDDGLNSYDSSHYLKTINLVKILNQIKTLDFGIFLTYGELLNIGWESFFKMLLNRDQYLLSLKIMDLLHLNQFKDMVYIHWCCYKVRKEMNLSDAELLKIISNKLYSFSNSNEIPDAKKRNYVSVEQITDAAYEEGRITLCKLLIDFEPSIQKKISQYFKYDETELGLIKAFQTGEYDLIKFILLHLQKELSISQFFKVLNQNEIKNELKSLVENKGAFPITGDLIGHFWLQSIGKQHSKLMETYFIQQDKTQELGISRIKSFLKKNQSKSNDTYYADYKSRLLKSISRVGMRRMNKIYQRELEVLELQKKLGETYMTNFFLEKSLNDILIKLIKMNQIKACKSIIKDFNIASEKLWILVLNTYTSSKDFDKLYQFAIGLKTANLTPKSPIGFKPFVDAGFKFNAPKSHISEYIKNCTNLKYSERIELFIKNNDLESAANEAFKNRDVDRLRRMMETLGGEDERLIVLLKGYITKLGY
ncbi:vacuolar protein sorting-associated protein 16 [Suhomyces tanzawaensis NRRL Y-17324]|uniref:Probable vacuolar protein sorting-associated protein 16 homolog n=1 Tax=Suhomyces tanzawaensis NRRL Y-17324 TaxID=984487 RepID=A0A1E4SNB6_9ASCO|nr:vacuolar protein sorting-associated protein 16 [Suhomyces tanzawaensis NRRL Y-17324]ODV80882.1 vacuolar protein sorting-associated protein 16 [Suhomyces tanzawaensis NRRL Y-17324]